MNIFLVIVHILCIPAYCAFPEVKIEEGNLAGINFTLINGKVIRAFLGVPYASPPLGAKRFEVGISTCIFLSIFFFYERANESVLV